MNFFFATSLSGSEKVFIILASNEKEDYTSTQGLHIIMILRSYSACFRETLQI